jgi:hypothetical protein
MEKSGFYADFSFFVVGVGSTLGNSLALFNFFRKSC